MFNLRVKFNLVPFKEAASIFNDVCCIVQRLHSICRVIKLLRSNFQWNLFYFLKKKNNKKMGVIS